MQEQLAEAARFFLTSFRYKLYFPRFIVFVSNCINLFIKIVSRHRLHAIYGLTPFNLVDYVICDHCWDIDAGSINAITKFHRVVDLVHQ